MPPSPRIGQVAVTVDALHAGMHGCLVGGHVHESRHFFFTTESRELRIVVTPHAAVVFLGVGTRCGEKEQ